jgi:aminoglycoside N3'-acetyltransferase
MPCTIYKNVKDLLVSTLEARKYVHAQASCIAWENKASETTNTNKKTAAALKRFSE